MKETEKMQKIHQLAVNGENLKAEEKDALQSWYEELDQEENSNLNFPQPFSNSTDLREHLADTTKQAAKISCEIESLVTQNAKLRNENKSLRKALESSLLEKAA